jgi:hypothetical protein
MPYNFAMKIDGFVGSGWEGDIGVDEIFLSDDECPPQLWCDFETSYCGWTNDTTGDFFWTRAQKSTDSAGTGPSTGIYFERKDFQKNFILIFYRSYYWY